MAASPPLALAAAERVALEARWLDLTRRALPEAAAARGWPIRHDHCFQRVLLDHVCGGVWYAAIAHRPAFRHATDIQLGTAVAAAENVLSGTLDLPALNRASLSARGK